MLAVSGELPSFALGPLDRFEILARLGQGSHGVVYEAFDRQQGQRVALKTLRFADASNLLRLKREFRELVSLHHPSLVELGELFEDHGRWFFSMQLVPGVDWTSYIRRIDDDATITISRATGTPSCDIARLRSALVQLGRGLEVLHDAGKLHRDIKPSNIRIQSDGHLVLLDFGLVATLRRGAAADPELAGGTVAYMSPEQAALSPLSAASDCYAVGVLLFEALTGFVPFQGTLLEILAAKQTQIVRIPAELAARLPADLVALCHDLCAIDPQLRPTAAQLAARAGGQAAANGPALAARPPLLCLGRERELAAMSGALERARAGELAHVCVYGEPGIGKSTLLAAFAGAVSRDVLLLRGCCHERERVPYNALDAVIDALGEQLSRMTIEQQAELVPRHAAALAHVFPVLDRLCAPEHGRLGMRVPEDPIALRAQAYGALTELLAKLGQRAPVVLLLDDLQWSDGESLALLHAIMHSPEARALMIVTAAWPPARCSEWLRGKLAVLSPQPTEIELRTLPDAAARALAVRVMEQEGSEPEPERLSAIAARSGNHPLLIELLARAAARGTDHPAGLEEALQREVLHHTPEARRVLQLTAVAGAPVTFPVLQLAAGLSAAECAKALDALRAAGLIVLHDRSSVPRVAIFHAQIRDGVCATLDEQSLCALHHALARALAQEPTRDYEALAVHWERAGCPCEAALSFVQAAEQADRVRAFAHAAGLYERALACMAGKQSADERRAWVLRQAAALANAGRSREAGATYLQAAELAEPEEARAAQRLAARSYLSAGDCEHGLAIARQLLAELDEHLPRSTSGALAAALWQRVRLSQRMRDIRDRFAPFDAHKALACDLLFDVAVQLSMLDMVRSWELHMRSLSLAIELGEPQRVARGLATEALYVDARSTADELYNLGIMARAEHIAQRSGDPHLCAWVKLCSASRHLLGGDPRLALGDADEALEMLIGQCRDVAWQIGSANAVSLSALSALGRFAELERRYASAVEQAQQRGDVPCFVTMVATNRCIVDLVADRPQQCRAELEQLARDWPAERDLQHTHLLCGQVLIDLYLGGDAAHRRLERAWPMLRRQPTFYNDRIRVLLTIARAVAALAALAAHGGKQGARSRIVRRCAKRLLSHPARDARASGHFLLAQLAVWQGDAAGAVEQYQHAIAWWDGTGIYLAWVAKQRMAELTHDTALIEEASTWARSQRIVRMDRFFAISAPITAVMLGRGAEVSKRLTLSSVRSRR